jgi:hypothetical protein
VDPRDKPEDDSDGVWVAVQYQSKTLQQKSARDFIGFV